MDGQQTVLSHEKEVKAKSGWLMLAAVIAIFAISVALFILAAVWGGSESRGGGASAALVIVGIVLVAVGSLLSFGFFTLEPNETRVLRAVRRTTRARCARAASAGPTPSTRTVPRSR